MINAEFQPSLHSSAPVTITEDPYVFLELYARDPTNIYVSYCSTWTKSDSNIYSGRVEGADMVGLHGWRTLTTGY